MRRDYLLGSYPLDSVSSPGGDTIWYSLIFDEKGNMAVEQHHDFNQPYKNDRVTDLPPENWDNFQVNGVPLRQLVINKLKEILPKPEPSRSCIKPSN
jgi:hypothetical protein